jgi:hypothetical protein
VRTLLPPLGRAALAIVLLAIALHVAVLAGWRFTLRPWMAQQRHPERLEAPTVREFPTPHDGWIWLDTGPVRLRVPLAAPSSSAWGACDEGCRVALGGRAVLAVQGVGAPDDYRRTVLLLAPDLADVSFWEPPWRNLETIRALGMRAGVTSSPPETFRFEQPGARGVVSRHANHGVERFVVYAFGPDGGRAPVLTTSRVPRPTLLRMLGSLEVREPALGPSGRP